MLYLTRGTGRRQVGVWVWDSEAGFGWKQLFRNTQEVVSLTAVTPEESPGERMYERSKRPYEMISEPPNSEPL